MGLVQSGYGPGNTVRGKTSISSWNAVYRKRFPTYGPRLGLVELAGMVIKIVMVVLGLYSFDGDKRGTVFHRIDVGYDYYLDLEPGAVA